MANFGSEFFSLVSPLFQPPPKKKFTPKFTPKIVGIPLQFHLETQKLPVPVLKGRNKRSQNLAPVLVIISGNFLVFLGQLLPVLVFTGAALPARQHQ